MVLEHFVGVQNSAVGKQLKAITWLSLNLQVVNSSWGLSKSLSATAKTNSLHSLSLMGSVQGASALMGSLFEWFYSV